MQQHFKPTCMNSNYLFPASCRKVGWMLCIPFLPGCLYCLLADGDSGFGGWLDEICVSGMIIALLLTAFSREKDEDECIGNLRLKALAWAVYASCGLQFVATWCLYDLSYLYFSFSAFASVLVFFILIYQWMLYRFRRENHE